MSQYWPFAATVTRPVNSGEVRCATIQVTAVVAGLSGSGAWSRGSGRRCLQGAQMAGAIRNAPVMLQLDFTVSTGCSLEVSVLAQSESAARKAGRP